MCKMIEKGLIGLAPRRKAAGFTQQSYADALDVPRSVVASYEAGFAWPPASRLPAMASLLGCSIDELYELPEETGTDCHASAAAPARNDSIEHAEA